MSDRKRLLNELRVIDLRCELERRNLDKSGVRGVLIQRLSKHLEEEGEDPTTFKFELGADVKTPAKRTRRSESAIEPESEETPAMEDMIVQDDVGEEEETELTDKKDNSLDQDTAETMETEENEKVSRKREIKDEPIEATEAKKPCLDEIKIEDQKIDNTDAEDSINLDLGDDELLNEEADNTSKSKKDEAAEDADGDDAERQAAELAPQPDAEPACEELPQVADGSATSNDAEANDTDKKDDKDKDSEGDKKEKKDDNKEGGARNLWVSGLSGDTRAKDLKQLCSRFGKVIGAKVVTNAKTPGSRCYGYVTMASAQDAENCIKNLHRTELHGRMISVEKAKSESETSRRQPSRSEGRSSKEQKEDAKENEDGKEDTDKVDIKEEPRSTSRTREKSQKSDKDRRGRSTRSRERRRSPREVLSFSKIWKERDVARARERSRAAREEERRRRAAEDALRERERRQRQEKHRLALEREKLRAEREKIEREKNELLRLERERHRLEREKLELERLDLKRAQIRLEEERRKRSYESSAYRKAASPPPEPYAERHKRAPPPPSSSRQFEAPPPPRFEINPGYERADKRDRDYKREYPQRHTSSASIKYPSNGNTNEDPRQQLLPTGVRPKEPSRSYESRGDSRSYRPAPTGKPEPRGWSASARYPNQAPPNKSSSGGASWEAWSGGGGDARYGSGAPRYPQYQPPPPGVYDNQPRDYVRKY